MKTSIRKRDILIGLICILVLLFTFQQEGSISLQRGFFIPKGNDQGKKLKDLKERTAQIGSKLLIAQGRTIESVNLKKVEFLDDWGECPREKVLTMTDAKGEVIGIHVGKVSEQKNVVVLVTNQWEVYCFDERMELIWKQVVEHPMDTHLVAELKNNPDLEYVVEPPNSEILVTILPNSIYIQDEGVVIFGGLKTTYLRLNNQKSTASVEKKYENSHFSYFAFDGKTGSLRWKHEAGDSVTTTLSPQHQFSISLGQELDHTSEIHWRNFKDSFLNEALPFVYRNDRDTKLKAAHFEPLNKKSNGKSFQTNFQKAYHSYFSNQEKNKLKNVLISHTRDKIEVLHLYTGITLCTFGPLKDNQIYSSFSEIDSIQSAKAYITTESSTSDRCVAEIETHTEELSESVFKTGICTVSTGIRRFAPNVIRRHQENEITKESEEIATPSIFTRFSGLSAEVIADPIFLASNGLVTCLTRSASENTLFSNEKSWKIKWQTSTPSKWTRKKENQIFPQITGFRLHSQSKDSFILAVGQNYLTVINPDGDVERIFELPSGATEPIEFLDFNNDGTMDLLIHTSNGYYGVLIKTHSGKGMIKFFMLSLLSILGLLYTSTLINVKKPA